MSNPDACDGCGVSWADMIPVGVTKTKWGQKRWRYTPRLFCGACVARYVPFYQRAEWVPWSPPPPSIDQCADGLRKHTPSVFSRDSGALHDALGCKEKVWLVDKAKRAQIDRDLTSIKMAFATHSHELRTKLSFLVDEWFPLEPQIMK